MEPQLNETQIGYVLRRKSDGQFAAYDQGFPGDEGSAPLVYFTGIFNATVWEPRAELPPEMRELTADKTAYGWLKVCRSISTL